MKELAAAFAALVVVLTLWFGLASYIEPNCPPYSKPKMTRGGWYCVVPPDGR